VRLGERVGETGQKELFRKPLDFNTGEGGKVKG
jgi:hypothetical protein